MKEAGAGLGLCLMATLYSDDVLVGGVEYPRAIVASVFVFLLCIPLSNHTEHSNDVYFDPNDAPALSSSIWQPCLGATRLSAACTDVLFT